MAGSSYLGRSWGDYAQVVFQNSDYNSIITPEGWSVGDAMQSVSNVFFAEYKNTNADGKGKRVGWAKLLDTAYNIGKVLPTYSYWVDKAYLGIAAV